MDRQTEPTLGSKDITPMSDQQSALHNEDL